MYWVRLLLGFSDEPAEHLPLHVFATGQPSPMLLTLTGRLCRSPALLPGNGFAYFWEKKHGRLRVIASFWQQTHSFSHSGNCRVKSKRAQLDMWMGGGGCSSLVWPASTVSDWLDWLSHLRLGRFKIAQSYYCAWLDGVSQTRWYQCALMTAAAVTLKRVPSPSLPPSPHPSRLPGPACCRALSAFPSLLLPDAPL